VWGGGGGGGAAPPPPPPPECERKLADRPLGRSFFCVAKRSSGDASEFSTVSG